MLKSLKHCDVDSASARQPLCQYRAATIHHRLASMYHSCLRNQVLLPGLDARPTAQGQTQPRWTFLPLTVDVTVLWLLSDSGHVRWLLVHSSGRL